MKIIGIEHIGIAVNDLNTSSSFWENILNIVHTHTEDVESEGVSTKIFDTGKGKIELLDSLDKNSPIHKFLQKKGPGIHHICLEVDDINNSITELKKFKIDIKVFLISFIKSSYLTINIGAKLRFLHDFK